jgi:hypothetical protein
MISHWTDPDVRGGAPNYQVGGQIGLDVRRGAHVVPESGWIGPKLVLTCAWAHAPGGNATGELSPVYGTLSA